MAENKKVYVVGHKNPDTDSICTAIAYANLKTKITGETYEPRRAGQLNEETQYVLEHFGVKVPLLLSDLREQIKNVELKEVLHSPDLFRHHFPRTSEIQLLLYIQPADF